MLDSNIVAVSLPAIGRSLGAMVDFAPFRRRTFVGAVLAMIG
jgi:hypothetical protein